MTETNIENVPMAQFVVWNLRGVRFLCHKPDLYSCFADRIKRLP